MKRFPLFAFAVICITLFSLSSCKPGEGGSGSITGIVLYKDTAATPVTQDTVYMAAQVYLSYGESSGVSADQQVLTDANGAFTFKPLKPGDYYVHAVFTDTLGKRFVAGAPVTLGEKGANEEVVVIAISQ